MGLRLRRCNGQIPMPIQPDYLLQQSRSNDAAIASVADNCRFDERASAARWQKFEDLLVATGPGGRLEWQDWSEANELQMLRFCQVPSTSVPDAFLAVNRRAWLPDISAQQSVVRIEVLVRPLNDMGWTLEHLHDLLHRVNAQAHDAEARAAMRVFFETWNGSRDGRPSFVAFHDEVRDEAGGHDWAHALRDRLGLGHLGQTDGSRLPVALMRYRLADVSARSPEGQAACALPTVLDGGMHEFFFSVPQESTYGATLHLDPDQADVLTAEIVHRRFDYLPEHLWRLGYIDNARRLRGTALRESRDLHLLALREETERRDFGEPFEGRQ